MGFNIISAAEAASYIKHGYNIGLSGFTPAGTPKAVTPEVAKIAEEEHAKGNPFQISIFTGASTGDATDGILSRVKAIRYRAPYTTNPDFRKAVNNGEIAYNDIHLSQMAQEVRYGFMGKVDVAILEACEITPDGKVYLTAAGGIAPTIARLADKVIIELNAAHSKNGMGLHDVYEPLDPPYRREIPIFKPSDRIGLPYVQVDPKKIIGVVEVNTPDQARSFTAPDPLYAIFVATFLQLMKYAILFPRICITCIPSRSCFTSSGFVPCTIFQYLDVIIGICIRPKYLFT